MSGHNVKTCPRMKSMQGELNGSGLKRARKATHDGGHDDDPPSVLACPRGYIPVLDDDGEIEFADCPRGYYPVKHADGQISLVKHEELDQPKVTCGCGVTVSAVDPRTLLRHQSTKGHLLWASREFAQFKAEFEEEVLDDRPECSPTMYSGATSSAGHVQASQPHRTFSGSTPLLAYPTAMAAAATEVTPTTNTVTHTTDTTATTATTASDATSYISIGGVLVAYNDVSNPGICPIQVAYGSYGTPSGDDEPSETAMLLKGADAFDLVESVMEGTTVMGPGKLSLLEAEPLM